MTEQPIGNQTSNKGLTFRAVVIALTLMPVNTYFIITNEVKYIGTLATTMSLIYNVIISLTVLIIINALIKRFFPRFALQQGELMTIYMMLSLSSAIAGHDMMQTVAPTLSHGFWFATPENEWKTLFWRHLPPWLTLNDPLSLLDFYEGQEHALHKSTPPTVAPPNSMVDSPFNRPDLGDDLHGRHPTSAVDPPRTVGVSDCSAAVGDDPFRWKPVQIQDAVARICRRRRD